MHDLRVPAALGFLATAGALLCAGAIAEPHRVAVPRNFDCGHAAAQQEIAELRAAVARGEIADPAARSIPAVAEGLPRPRPGGPRSLTTDDIYPFEDSDQLLVSDWTLAQLIDLMVTAANELLSVYGDNYDYIGFWMNYAPNHPLGGAFYKRIQNDVSGLGLGLFNYRPDLGLAGENVEGMVMLYDVNSYWWDPPGGPYAEFTQLMISHEFEHRWAMFLPPLADGRNLQGDADSTVGGPCGKVGHWSYRVDGQGSAMEIREWVGSRPALLDGAIWSLNGDIPGGVFSYPDLYLMGYVSPEEMDAGASELRYMMQTATCATGYQGPITAWTSADIIETAGPRIPPSPDSQRDWRTGWIMLYLPGDPPDSAELGKAVAILEAHQTVWNQSTLGRGTMDHSLYEGVTAVAGGPSTAACPARVVLEIPSPNPLHPLYSETVLRYSLAISSRVSLTIHDVGGRRVATLVDGLRTAGLHSASWDGRDESGGRAASGVYFACIEAAGSVQTRKIVLVR